MSSREAVVSARILFFLFVALLAAALGMGLPSGMALGGAGIEVIKYITIERTG
ncbi:MAG: hypothetical protein LCI00_05445 [Chloroflexi bacterium]|nr:hypothetical protein [Chloroflexota bacterium]